jgi:hypothetical protein
MRETTWFCSSADDILETGNKLIGNNSNYVDFSISRVLPVNIRVYSTSELYLNYLKDNFNTYDISSNIPIITLYYDRHNSIEQLKSVRPDLNLDIITPCAGLFDEVKNVGLITGLDEYGLLTSTVHGLYSRLLFSNNWNPIHGAVIDLNGQGTILIGHHGAGKSTALLNLIHYTKDIMRINVLTDDWSVARSEGSAIKICSIEKKMSFSESLVNANPELNLIDLYKNQALGGIGKLWIDIDDVLGSGTSIQETTLKNVLIFSPNNGDELITNISLDEAVHLLVDTSYHMPDCGEGIKERQLSFWNTSLKAIKFFQVDSRYSHLSKEKIYNLLVDYIIS